MSTPVFAFPLLAQSTQPAVEPGVAAAPTTSQTTIAPGGTPAPAKPARQGWMDFSTSPMVPILLVMVLFIWMSSRSRRKQEQQKKDMLSQMKRGDRVQTIGGILGAVVETRDDRILVKVDESNNTKVWFARSAIHRVLGEETAAADAK